MRDSSTSLGMTKLRAHRADTAIILGSGLSSIVPDECETIPYSEFKELPKPSVPGHAGKFALAKIDPPSVAAATSGVARNRPVIFAQGRVHLYEGFSAHEVTAGVRLLAEAGIKQLIVTNAAGSLNPKFPPGSWMMITDHVNLTGTSPLVGTVLAAAVSGGRSQFIDMTDAYSPRLRKQFADGARKLARGSSSEGGIDMQLHEGVYAAVLGPQYETPAEVRMLQKIGADAVGMSTVLEVIQARALGLEVAGFSCLTNFAAGISKEKLSHDEVLEVGKKAAANFARLLEILLS